MALLVGAWGAVATFIGPYFGWHPTSRNTWAWITQNWLLHLIPGAVAVAAGLMLLAMMPARRMGTSRPLVLPAVLLMAAGAWFVIGPLAWPTFHSGPAFEPLVSAGRNLVNQACASMAPGLILAALGGMALKAGIARPAVAVEDVGPAAYGGEVGNDTGTMAREDAALAEREGAARGDTRMMERDRLARDEGMAMRSREGEGVGMTGRDETAMAQGDTLAGGDGMAPDTPVGRQGRRL